MANNAMRLISGKCLPLTNGSNGVMAGVLLMPTMARQQWQYDQWMAANTINDDNMVLTGAVNLIKQYLFWYDENRMNEAW